jgi:hypothetical protein
MKIFFKTQSINIIFHISKLNNLKVIHIYISNVNSNFIQTTSFIKIGGSILRSRRYIRTYQLVCMRVAR